MSIKFILAAMQLQGLSSLEKLLLLTLANYADDAGRCFPRNRRLSLDTGMAERTLRAVIAKLEGQGLLCRDRRKRPDGSQQSNLYTLSAAKMAELGAACDATPAASHAAPLAPDAALEPVTEPSRYAPLSKGRAITVGRTSSKASRRAPDGWAPSDKTTETLLAEGFTPDALSRALALLRDHEFRTAKTDWDAAFRNWVRRDADPTNRSYRRDEYRSPAEARRAAREDNYRRARLASEDVA